MKTRVQIALFGCVLAIAAHLYLTLHYYPLKYGFATGQSICNLSAKFDCDAVSASSYATVLGMPLAVWGLAFNLVLFGLIFLGWLEWTANPERLKRWALFLAGTSVVASVVMASISLFKLQSFCLFCIALYVLSFIIFWAYLSVPKERPFFQHLKFDIPAILSGDWSILAAFAAIPIIAYLGHQGFMQNMNSSSTGGSIDAQVEQLVNESIGEWEAAPKQDFVAKPTLTMGAPADKAALTLVEFADFRCGHCKHASYTLDAFVRSHPDVRFEFYSFPLDGACNEKIEQSSGLSCRLAETVYCADREGKGWEMHHALYAAQDQVNQTSAVSDLDVILSKEVSQLGLNWQTLQTCIQDSATVDAIKAQAKQGGLVNVEGTPTIFANGRQLNRAQMMPILEAARSKAMQSH